MLKIEGKIALKLRLNAAGAAVLSAAMLLTTATDSNAGACRSSSGPGGGLTSRFWKTNRDTLTALPGQSAVIRGRLTEPDGTPRRGATIEIEEFLLGAGREAGERVALPRIGFARTARDGTYAYRMPAGPNREALVAHRAGGAEATCAVRYYSPARPTLEATPMRTRNRGRPVTLRGRLPGPYARGHVVVLQARFGDRWLTFKDATTDARGRFQIRYRFQRTFEAATYTFRALAPRQAGYPWLRGTSRLVAVAVYPQHAG